MNNSERGAIAAIALLIVVGAMFVTGGVYVYSKYQKDSADRELINSAQNSIRSSTPTDRAREISADLAWAKTRLKMETDKLNQLKTDAELAIKANPELLGKTYADIKAALVKIPVIKIPNAAVNAELSAQKLEVQKILETWQGYLANPTPENIAALQASISTNLNQVNNYIDGLSEAATTLTPGNSGLTQEQITNIQNAVNNAAQQVGTASSNVTSTTTTTSSNTTGSNTSGSTSTNTNKGTSVQEQQQVVDDIQEQIDDLEQEQEDVLNEINNQTGGNGTSTSTDTNTSTSSEETDPGIRYTPPPTTNPEGGPQLIQGINSQ
jgi:hypothetical protein